MCWTSDYKRSKPIPPKAHFYPNSSLTQVGFGGLIPRQAQDPQPPGCGLRRFCAQTGCSAWQKATIMQTGNAQIRKCVLFSILFALQLGIGSQVASADSNVVVPLAEALDHPDLGWTNYNSPGWFGQTLVTHDGIDAAQSPALPDGDSVTMQTT